MVQWLSVGAWKILGGWTVLVVGFCLLPLMLLKLAEHLKLWDLVPSMDEATLSSHLFETYFEAGAMVLLVPWIYSLYSATGDVITGATGKLFFLVMASLFLLVLNLLISLSIAYLGDTAAKTGSLSEVIGNLVATVSAGMAIIVVFACVYRVTGLAAASSKDTVRDFGTCLYFSVTTITTAGFGDVYPHDSASRSFAAVETLQGYFALALMVSILVPILGRLWKFR